MARLGGCILIGLSGIHALAKIGSTCQCWSSGLSPLECISRDYVSLLDGVGAVADSAVQTLSYHSMLVHRLIT